jgi:hypothetical protein
MNVVSGHSLEAFLLYKFPKFGVGSVNYSRKHFWVLNWFEELFGTDLLYGMSLSSPNVNVLSLIFEFKPFLIVGLDDGLNIFEVDVFVAFVIFEVFQDVVYFDEPCCVHLQSLLKGSMPQQIRKRLRKLDVMPFILVELSFILIHPNSFIIFINPNLMLTLI